MTSKCTDSKQNSLVVNTPAITVSHQLKQLWVYFLMETKEMKEMNKMVMVEEAQLHNDLQRPAT